MARVFLIQGTPGVGKSTLARRLALKLGIPMVDLGVLVKREKLYREFDRKKRTYVMDEGRVRRRLESFVKDTDAVVATHSVGKTVSPRWVKRVIVLRLDPAVLYQRLRSKGWSRRKAWENVEAELVDVCLQEAVMLFGREKVFEVDATSKPLSKVLSEALRIVKGKARASRFRVDWLSTYDPVTLGRRLGWKSSSW